MSIRYMSWVFDCSKSENASRLVALALADHADDYGRCWPGYQRIAAKTRLSLRTIGRAIADLIELGEVEIVREHYKGKQTKIYQMKQPDNLSSSQIVAKIASTPDNLSKQPDNLSPITVINRQQDKPSKKIPSKKKTESLHGNCQVLFDNSKQARDTVAKDALWNAWQTEYQKVFKKKYIPTAADWKQIKEREIYDLDPQRIVKLVHAWFNDVPQNERKYFHPYLKSFACGWEKVEEFMQSTKNSKDIFNKVSGWEGK